MLPTCVRSNLPKKATIRKCQTISSFCLRIWTILRWKWSWLKRNVRRQKINFPRRHQSMSPSRIRNWIAIRLSRRAGCWRQATSTRFSRWSEINYWSSNSPPVPKSLRSSQILVPRPISKSFWACLSQKGLKMVKLFSQILPLLSPTGSLMSPRSLCLKMANVTAVFWSSLMSYYRLSCSPQSPVWRNRTAWNKHQKLLKRRTSSNFPRLTVKRIPHLSNWAVRSNLLSRPFKPLSKYHFRVKTSSLLSLRSQRPPKTALKT